MKPSEVREKSDAELVRLAAELEEELFRLRFRLGGQQLKQTTNIRTTRRDLARVKTALRERAIRAERGGERSL